MTTEEQSNDKKTDLKTRDVQRKCLSLQLKIMSTAHINKMNAHQPDSS